MGKTNQYSNYRECHVCGTMFRMSAEAIKKTEFENGAYTCSKCAKDYAEDYYNPKEFFNPKAELYTPFMLDPYGRVRECENFDRRQRLSKLKACGLFRDKKFDFTVEYPS
jgi:hypothetical protein